MTHKPLFLVAFALLILSILACGLSPVATQPVGSNINTLAAQTVEALTTQLAITQAAGPAVQPTNTQLPQPSPAPTTAAVQPTPTWTILAPQTSETPTQATPCDRATFVSETVIDNSQYYPASSFTKTWVLKNNGTCTWNSSYSLVFDSGDAMGAAPSKPLTTGTIAPGDQVTLSVDLTAPVNPGTYKGKWKLKNGSDQVFGIGAAADKSFWVQIIVVNFDKTFTTAYCSANWTGSTLLSCPGADNDTGGLIQLINGPKLENGFNENGPALLTVPPNMTNGVIYGKYPPVTLQNGQHFKATVGCMFNMTDCNVKFIVKLVVDGSTQTIFQMDKAYNGNRGYIDLDLSSFAGKSVQIILAVQANSSPRSAQAYWVNPVLTP